MYIHSHICISPQQTFREIDLHNVNQPADNKLFVKEPKYEGIPMGVLRRMGRAVRFGVGSATPLLQKLKKADGIVIGTGNGGMEDCIKFLNQIIQYDEGTLTPTNFVQSTPNAIAAQLGLMAGNTGYNITHVHRGLAFENALLDVKMLLNENPANTYLLGGLDEISDYNYNIEYLGGWYKRESVVTGEDLYESTTAGSIAGEGAAMFFANGNPEKAIANVRDVRMFHVEDPDEIKEQLELFLNRFSGESIDLLISGENGDARFKPYYSCVESMMHEHTGVARFKHLTGEYPSVSSFALWMAAEFLMENKLPHHIIKNFSGSSVIKNILIYNNYKGLQHSFIWVSK